MTDARKLAAAGVSLVAAGAMAIAVHPPGLTGSSTLIASLVVCALGIAGLAAAAVVAGTPERSASGEAAEELFSPYRSPGFLVEPLARGDVRDGSLPTTLGLCAALALLGGSFTLFVAGPPALGAFCLVAGLVLTSAARHAR